MEHLLGAQAFTPVVDRAEMAGFDFVGSRDEMRALLAARVDSIAEYRTAFERSRSPDVGTGDPIELRAHRCRARGVRIHTHACRTHRSTGTPVESWMR